MFGALIFCQSFLLLHVYKNFVWLLSSQLLIELTYKGKLYMYLKFLNSLPVTFVSKKYVLKVKQSLASYLFSPIN